MDPLFCLLYQKLFTNSTLSYSNRRQQWRTMLYQLDGSSKTKNVLSPLLNRSCCLLRSQFPTMMYTGNWSLLVYYLLVVFNETLLFLHFVSNHENYLIQIGNSDGICEFMITGEINNELIHIICTIYNVHMFNVYHAPTSNCSFNHSVQQAEIT